MAAENKKSRSSTPTANSAANNLSFSVDSLQLGDSTRSLLSPLYDSDRKSLKGRSIHSEDDELSEDEVLGKSMSSESSSDDDHSETITVKKAKNSSPAYGSGSLRSNSSRTSSYSSIKSSSMTPISNKSSESRFENEIVLSPWEKWLMSKVIEDGEKARLDSEKKRLGREMVARKMAEETDNERKAEVNRREWLRLKHKEETLRNKLKRGEENARICKEQEENERIQKNDEESYAKWHEMKEHERGKMIKNRKKEECVRKGKEDERKERSQESYQAWLSKAKSHQKSTNNHFGYLSGKVRGYYDWTCYPMPSYSNPKPWVSPKVKKHCQGKLEFQHPSPPLLFKELEERERNAKERNSKLKKTKKGI